MQIEAKSAPRMQRPATDAPAALAPIGAKTLTDEVERRLRTYIRDNGFAPGDPLPGEQELAEELAVSRNVVREAISRLRMLGLVESRKRRGMVVGRPDVAGVLERLVDMAFLMPEDTLAFAQLRAVLEIGLADLLVGRVTGEDLDALAGLGGRIDAMVEAAPLETRSEAEQETLFALETAFHTRLFELTGNAVLQRFAGLLAPFFHAPVRRSAAARKQQRIGHRRLAEVLRLGSAGAFREAMSAHLQPAAMHVGEKDDPTFAPPHDTADDDTHEAAQDDAEADLFDDDLA